MSALFLRPYRMTIVSGSQTATAPHTNLTYPEHPGLVWRTTGTAAHVIIDLGASVRPYDYVAIVGSNLLATNTVRVRTGVSNTGIGTYDSGTQPAFTGTKPEGFSTQTVLGIPQRSERYVRIDISAPGLALIEVQTIVLGKGVTTLGIDYDAEHSVIDPSMVEQRMGADIIEKYKSRMRWKFSISFIEGSAWRTQWLAFLTSVGRTEPFLFVPNMLSPADVICEATFGRIRNEAIGKTPGGDVRKVELVIEGLAL